MNTQSTGNLILHQSGETLPIYQEIKLTKAAKIAFGSTSERGEIVNADVPPHSQYAIISYPASDEGDTISSSGGGEVVSDISTQSIANLSNGEESNVMTQPLITKGEFDANIKRFDDTVSNLKENISTRFTSIDEKIDLRFNHMDEKIDMNFRALSGEVRQLTESIQSQRKEIHNDNLATRLSSYAVLATMVLGFLAVLLTILRL